LLVLPVVVDLFAFFADELFATCVTSRSEGRKRRAPARSRRLGRSLQALRENPDTRTGSLQNVRAASLHHVRPRSSLRRSDDAANHRALLSGAGMGGASASEHFPPEHPRRMNKGEQCP
jgi:hypothetical protein